MSKEKIDPELADDRDVQEVDIHEVELPEYDPTQFESPLGGFDGEEDEG